MDNLQNNYTASTTSWSKKWYQFGVAAGMLKDALDKIAEQCPPDECIVEMLDYKLDECH